MNVVELTESLTVSGSAGPDRQVAEWPTARVPVRSLLPALSPRLAGESVEHIRVLAESRDVLPPIVVHRPTMRVIDGMHRLRAAQLRGENTIEVRFYDGDEANAFVLAVEANIAHGLPLSLSDRTAAATRIINSHPQWSDRKIAAVIGLADTTVSAIRHRSTAVLSQSNTRIGRDGRTRPLTAAPGRTLASELIKDRPEASIREIAREAGVSPSTVLDVRRRLYAGEDPVPLKQRADQARSSQTRMRPRSAGEMEHKVARPSPSVDRTLVLQNLRKDPSLAMTDSGRDLLRWLYRYTIDIDEGEWVQLLDNVPAHCAGRIAELAHETANAWHQFAERLDRR